MDPIKVIKNEEYLAAAQGILAQARREVILCTYKFELSPSAAARGLNSLIDTLFVLAAAGKKIRVLLNITGHRAGLTRINENAARVLKGKKIQVRCLPDNRCQHAKMLLVDGCLGIIGSHNWTPRSMSENYEVSVVIQSPAYLVDIQAHFEKIWERAKEL